MYGTFATGTVTTASTNQQIYRFSTNAVAAEWDLKLINPTANIAVVKLWVSKTTSPANADLFEFAVNLAANGGVFQATKEITAAGDYIYINSTVAGIAYRLTGKELTKFN